MFRRFIGVLTSLQIVLRCFRFKRLKRQRREERDKAHQVSFVLERRPNPYQSPFKFKHLIETHRNTWGNAYINIHWGVDGRPKNYGY